MNFENIQQLIPLAIGIFVVGLVIGIIDMIQSFIKKRENSPISKGRYYKFVYLTGILATVVPVLILSGIYVYDKIVGFPAPKYIQSAIPATIYEGVYTGISLIVLLPLWGIFIILNYISKLTKK